MGPFQVGGIVTMYSNKDIYVTQTFLYNISSIIQAWISINTTHFYEC
jgi:hypothetical protein